MANKAQKFLLDNNCGDLILNDHRTTKPKDRIYSSDIMMMFLESERERNIDTSEKQLTTPVVVPRISHFTDENGNNVDVCAGGVNVVLKQDGTHEYFRSYGFAGRNKLTPVYN